MNRMGAALRAAVLVLAAAPIITACQDSLNNQTIGPSADSTSKSNANVNFIRYAAIGTSISAGIQSGGINDSTQREAFTYQLAVSMGLTPGANWFYPSLKYPGCPAPFTNPLTGSRVGGVSAAACAFRDPASTRPYVSNTAIPSIRAGQVIDITSVPFPATDTLKLTQFITGGAAPMDMVEGQNPTFITVEMGANDVLGAATRGDPALLTASATFSTQMTAIADRIAGIDPAPKVAIMNIPNVTSIPHFTKASILFCLKTGACPGVPATLPYSSPLFTVDASCAPNAAGGIGDTYLLPFPTTGAITNVLAASRAAKIDCGRDSALVAVAAAPAPATAPAGATINATEYATINAAVAADNAAIATLASSRGYALVDANAALAAIAAGPPCATSTQATPCIPAVPFFTDPAHLFGPIFSLDGIHPTKAGHRLIGQAFTAAINTKFSTSLAIP